jgi:DNA-binding transcriptional regulator YiaG
MVKTIGQSEILDSIRNSWPPWAPLLDQALLLKPSRLEPIEFRYLRERASWNASDAVHALGVSSTVTISRWETGSRRIPLPTERLFRLLVAAVLTNVPLRSLAEQLKTPWRQARASLRISLDPDESRYEYRWVTPPRKLPPAMQRLFWDTDMHKLDLVRHTDYIITRVLEKGDLEDWNWLRWTYGAARIARVAKENRKLNRQTAHLWQNILLTNVKVG